MDTPTLIAVAVGIVIIAVGIYQIRTGKSDVYDFNSALRAYRQAEELVATYVPAAEQLYKIGALPKDQRLEYVIGMVLSFVDELDTDQIRGLVEAYVRDRLNDSGN